MLVKLMLFSAIMIVLGVFVPHLLMVYEVKSGAPFVVCLLVAGVLAVVFTNKETKKSKAQAKVRAHMEESSLYSD